MEQIGYKAVKFRFVGVSPLLMHNLRLADPLDPIVKQMKVVSAKRKKTDDDHALMATLEWAGSLYATEPVQVDSRGNIVSGGKVCVPGEMLEGMIIAGAKRIRAKAAFQSGVMVDGDSELEHNGPKSIGELQNKPGYHDRRGVRVQNARIMRTRPIFRQWSFVATFLYLPDVIESKDSLREVIETCGRIIGIGDYRPKYGRFMVEEV